MSENNNRLERNYEVAERRAGGPIVVTMDGGAIKRVPEILKDPREDSVTKMLHAFSEMFDGIWKKK